MHLMLFRPENNLQQFYPNQISTLHATSAERSSDGGSSSARKPCWKALKISFILERSVGDGKDDLFT